MFATTNDPRVAANTEDRAVDEDSELGNIIGRTHDILRGCSEIAAVAARTADRAFGSAPTADGGSKPQAVRAGAIGTIHDVLDQIDRVQSEAFGHLNRLRL